MLGQGPTFGINGSFYSPEKKLVLILVKQTQNFAGNKNINLPTRFCLGSISNAFSAIESREVSLN